MIFDSNQRLKDPYSGYWQYYIADEDIPKTTFFVRYNLYKLKAMPMGLMKAPDIFMQTTNNLFSNMRDSSMAVFLDDILVCLCTVKEHFILFENVLAYLHQYIFFYELKKCSFLCTSTIFLSFDITPRGMCINDLKVQSLNE